MNYKQKLGYTALGAVIMLVGLGLGAIVSPPLIAQKDGALDEIQCSRLTVVDKTGQSVVAMGTDEEGRNTITLFNEVGKEAVHLFADKQQTSVKISRPSGTEAIHLFGAERLGAILLDDDAGKIAVSLSVADKVTRGVLLFDEEGESAVTLTSNILGNNVTVYDSAGNKKWVAP